LNYIDNIKEIIKRNKEPTMVALSIAVTVAAIIFSTVMALTVASAVANSFEKYILADKLEDIVVKTIPYLIGFICALITVIYFEMV
jgi:hypothetical protein